MKIAYNPITAGVLTNAPANNDITFDLRGLNIFVRGVKFKGTDTTYSVFKKHTSSGGGYNGLVPVPSYTSTNVRFLREDGTWQVPSNQYTYSSLTNQDLDTLKTEGKWYYLSESNKVTNGPSDISKGGELYVGRNASGYRYQKVILYNGLIWFRIWDSSSWSDWKRWYTDANTDSKVLQSNTTTTNYRPIILGYNNNADHNDISTSVTQQVYTTTSIYAQPSTGSLWATKLYSGGKLVVTDVSNYVTLNTAQTITGQKTFTSQINSSLNTTTYLEGNKGKAIINSTAGAGQYVMLFKGNSTNGYFTHGVYKEKYLLQYTAKSTVDAGTNDVTKSVALLDEYGNSQFSGNVTAPKFIGPLQGNADSATKLQTARQINGTNFDGTANITTSIWGTTRNITIGNTKKAVNGSADVAWSLTDIGAAAASHTHTIFRNNLMIKGTDGISDSASIHLALGDSDTGFKWISDGVCQMYANNIAIGQWNSDGMNWLKQPTVNGQKIWHAGNDGDFFKNREGFHNTTLDTFSSRNSGTYIVDQMGYSGLLSVFKSGSGGGSVSAMELFAPHYDISYGLRYRLAIDNNRYTKWRDFVFSDELEPLKNGSDHQPIVLVTGYFYRSSTSSSLWYFYGYKHSQIGNPSFYINGGVMRLTFSNTGTIIFSSAYAQGRRNFSGNNTTKTQAYDGSNGDYEWRGEGTYWFNSYVSNSGTTSYLYIRAYRNANTDNDSWFTGKRCWYNEEDSIESVSFSIFGYIQH